MGTSPPKIRPGRTAPSRTSQRLPTPLHRSPCCCSRRSRGPGVWGPQPAMYEGTGSGHCGATSTHTMACARANRRERTAGQHSRRTSTKEFCEGAPSEAFVGHFPPLTSARRERAHASASSSALAICPSSRSEVQRWKQGLSFDHTPVEGAGPLYLVNLISRPRRRVKTHTYHKRPCPPQLPWAIVAPALAGQVAGTWTMI